MSKQEPKKHHYIPRFILKNFNNGNGQVNYWNIEKDKLEKETPKVFSWISICIEMNLLIKIIQLK